MTVMFLKVTFLLIVKFIADIHCDCYGNGHRGTSITGHIYTMNGVNSTCIVTVGGKFSFAEAKKLCAEEYIDGTLMKIENYQILVDSSIKFNFPDWEDAWVDFPVEKNGSCKSIDIIRNKSTVYVNCSENQRADLDIICQYPFHYSCAYRTVLKSDKLVETDGKCRAEFQSLWLPNDADHRLNCTMQRQTYVYYNETEFCSCVKRHNWNDWSQWSICTSSCENGTSFRKRTHDKCRLQTPQTEIRSCNSQVPCPKKSSSTQSSTFSRSIFHSSTSSSTFSAGSESYKTSDFSSEIAEKQSTLSVIPESLSNAQTSSLEVAILVIIVCLAIGFIFLCIGGVIVFKRKLKSKWSKNFGLGMMSKSSKSVTKSNSTQVQRSQTSTLPRKDSSIILTKSTSGKSLVKKSVNSISRSKKSTSGKSTKTEQRTGTSRKSNKSKKLKTFHS